MKRLLKTGFTLIELLVDIAIIAIFIHWLQERTAGLK